MHGQAAGVPGHRRRHGRAAQDHEESDPGQHPTVHQDSDGGHAKAVQVAEVKIAVLCDPAQIRLVKLCALSRRAFN